MRRAAAWLLGLPLLCAALACALFAARADEAWFVRHVLTLDSYEPPWSGLPTALRTAAAALALLLLLAAVQIAWRPPSLGALLRSLLAVLLALLVSEAALRFAERHRSEERRTLHARLGQPDPRYGWIMRPSSRATVKLAGRDIELSFDARGNRIRSLAEAPIPSLPSLLVAGESVAAGHDLQWDETFAALAAAQLGVQAVNLAVNGYSVDQAWLRLTDALPSYASPRAVVMVVMPVQLGRNLIDNRPRLSLSAGGALELLPAASGTWAELRLRTLLTQLPYRTDAEIARTVALTQALLAELTARVRARGARPLYVVPVLGETEEWLIDALFLGQDLPHLVVRLNPDDRFPRDGHPNQRGAAKLAAAIVAALREP